MFQIVLINMIYAGEISTFWINNYKNSNILPKITKIMLFNYTMGNIYKCRIIIY